MNSDIRVRDSIYNKILEAIQTLNSYKDLAIDFGPNHCDCKKFTQISQLEGDEKRKFIHQCISYCFKNDKKTYFHFTTKHISCLYPIQVHDVKVRFVSEEMNYVDQIMPSLNLMLA